MVSVTKGQKSDWSVTFISGVLTRNVQYFGDQDPYCILKSQGKENRTRTHEKGGLRPVWNQTFDIKVLDYDQDVVLEVWDAGALSDTLIGSTIISLSEFMEAGETNKIVKIQYEGANVGEINIKSTFVHDESEIKMSQIQKKLSQDLENAKAQHILEIEEKNKYIQTLLQAAEEEKQKLMSINQTKIDELVKENEEVIQRLEILMKQQKAQDQLEFINKSEIQKTELREEARNEIEAQKKVVQKVQAAHQAAIEQQETLQLEINREKEAKETAQQSADQLAEICSNLRHKALAYAIVTVKQSRVKKEAQDQIDKLKKELELKDFVNQEKINDLRTKTEENIKSLKKLIQRQKEQDEAEYKQKIQSSLESQEHLEEQIQHFMQALENSEDQASQMATVCSDLKHKTLAYAITTAKQNRLKREAEEQIQKLQKEIELKDYQNQEYVEDLVRKNQEDVKKLQNQIKQQKQQDLAEFTIKLEQEKAKLKQEMHDEIETQKRIVQEAQAARKAVIEKQDQLRFEIKHEKESRKNAEEAKQSAEAGRKKAEQQAKELATVCSNLRHKALAYAIGTARQSRLKQQAEESILSLQQDMEENDAYVQEHINDLTKKSEDEIQRLEDLLRLQKEHDEVEFAKKSEEKERLIKVAQIEMEEQRKIVHEAQAAYQDEIGKQEILQLQIEQSNETRQIAEKNARELANICSNLKHKALAYSIRTAKENRLKIQAQESIDKLNKEFQAQNKNIEDLVKKNQEEVKRLEMLINHQKEKDQVLKNINDHEKKSEKEKERLRQEARVEVEAQYKIVEEAKFAYQAALEQQQKLQNEIQHEKESRENAQNIASEFKLLNEELIKKNEEELKKLEGQMKHFKEQIEIEYRKKSEKEKDRLKEEAKIEIEIQKKVLLEATQQAAIEQQNRLNEQIQLEKEAKEKALEHSKQLEGQILEQQTKNENEVKRLQDLINYRKEQFHSEQSDKSDKDKDKLTEEAKAEIEVQKKIIQEAQASHLAAIEKIKLEKEAKEQAEDNAKLLKTQLDELSKKNQDEIKQLKTIIEHSQEQDITLANELQEKISRQINIQLELKEKADKEKEQIREEARLQIEAAKNLVNETKSAHREGIQQQLKLNIEIKREKEGREIAELQAKNNEELLRKNTEELKRLQDLIKHSNQADSGNQNEKKWKEKERQIQEAYVEIEVQKKIVKEAQAAHQAAIEKQQKLQIEINDEKQIRQHAQTKARELEAHIQDLVKKNEQEVKRLEILLNQQRQQDEAIRSNDSLEKSEKERIREETRIEIESQKKIVDAAQSAHKAAMAQQDYLKEQVKREKIAKESAIDQARKLATVCSNLRHKALAYAIGTAKENRLKKQAQESITKISLDLAKGENKLKELKSKHSKANLELKKLKQEEKVLLFEKQAERFHNEQLMKEQQDQAKKLRDLEFSYSQLTNKHNSTAKLRSSLIEKDQDIKKSADGLAQSLLREQELAKKIADATQSAIQQKAEFEAKLQLKEKQLKEFQRAEKEARELAKEKENAALAAIKDKEQLVFRITAIQTSMKKNGILTQKSSFQEKAEEEGQITEAFGTQLPPDDSSCQTCNLF